MNDLEHVLSLSRTPRRIKRLGDAFIVKEMVDFDKISNNFQLNTLNFTEIIEKSTIRCVEIVDFLRFFEENTQNYVIMITSIDSNNIKGIGFHSGVIVTCDHAQIDISHIDNTLITGNIPFGFIQVENLDGHFDRVIHEQ